MFNRKLAEFAENSSVVPFAVSAALAVTVPGPNTQREVVDCYSETKPLSTSL
jgi:hypothetical protein